MNEKSDKTQDAIKAAQSAINKAARLHATTPTSQAHAAYTRELVTAELGLAIAHATEAQKANAAAGKPS